MRGKNLFQKCGRYVVLSVIVVTLFSVLAGEGFCTTLSTLPPIATTQQIATVQPIYAVAPTISASPNPAGIYQQVTITGHHFNVNAQTVSISTGETTISANIQSDGSFSTTYTYVQASISQPYTIKATDSKGDSATTTLVLQPPTLSISPTTFRVGDQVALAGSGYPTGQPIPVKIDNNPVSHNIPPTCIDASGKLNTNAFTWGAFGYLYPGQHAVSLGGSTPVTVTVLPMRAPTLSENPLTLGKGVQITGPAAEPNAQVFLYVQGGQLAQSTADATGSYFFTCSPPTVGSFTFTVQSEQITSDPATLTVVAASTPTPTPAPTAQVQATPAPTAQVQATPLPAGDPSQVYKYVAQWGSIGSANGQFRTPMGAAIDSAGNIYVSDTRNDRIEKFSSAGDYLTSFGSHGTGDGQLITPMGLAVDSGGNVYVVDQINDRIQKFSPSGIFLLKWGSHGSGPGQFNAAAGIAVDSGGNVYVTDSMNHRVQKFSATGNYVTSWGTAGTGDGQFQTPTGIAVDPAGNVYVVDCPATCVQKFTPSGAFLARWGGQGTGNGQFFFPRSIGIDASGDVFVGDCHLTTGGIDRVEKFTSTGAYLTQFGSSGSGDGQLNSTGINGIVIDKAGNVYVTDTNNNRIQKFALDQPAGQGQQSQSGNPGQSGATPAPTASQQQSGDQQLTPTPTGGQSQPNSSTGSTSPSGGDLSAPTTAIVLNGTAGNATGTYTSDVVVTLNASDAGGSGLKDTQYSFDGSSWLRYTGPFTVSKEGTTTVYARSTDNAGNVELGESATFTIARNASASAAAPKSASLCGAALLPLLLVGFVTLGAASQRKGRKN